MDLFTVLLGLFVAACSAFEENPPHALHAGEAPAPAAGRKLSGRFLHITDIHPDPFYKVYSSTYEDDACHRRKGPAGQYGAETSDCDSPMSLVNATFKWIEENLKDSIDFIIWTGDSARHDNDEKIPRSVEQVVGQNQMLVNKFREIFGSDRPDPHRPQSRLKVPIIPSIGNNDILPHNIFEEGPNRWTRTYLDVWRPFIPEDQRHAFSQGGWFYVEVIPEKLVVFSLNTMYFFGSNAAVDGCADSGEPGYEHMEWLRVQLQFLRERGVKAIMSGHVPPARSEEKVGWDETCWQKYTLWMQQFRDVVVGSVYGHMNIEHFILQDFEDIDYKVAAGMNVPRSGKRDVSASDVSIMVNAPDYLNSLRELWSDLPSVPDTETTGLSGDQYNDEKNKRKQQQKFYNEIGGEYAERFSLSLVTASIVPNYFTSLRVYEYNITGMEDLTVAGEGYRQPTAPASKYEIDDCNYDESNQDGGHSELKKRSFWEALKKKKKKKPKFKVPEPPSKSTPPGPAYSPQALSIVGYTQYLANNTHINNDFTNAGSDENVRLQRGNPIGTLKWHEGRHAGKEAGRSHPKPRDFSFEAEYTTTEDDDTFGFGKGLVMRKFVELAATIGEYDPKKDKSRGLRAVHGVADVAQTRISAEGAGQRDLDAEKKKDKKKKKKKKKEKKKRKKEKKKRKKEQREKINRTWYAFVSRAVVGTMSDDELRDEFG